MPPIPTTGMETARSHLPDRLQRQRFDRRPAQPATPTLQQRAAMA